MSVTEKPNNFLEQIIKKDLEEKRIQSVCTRFPPEPNGFLHIGHATSICLNFGLAEKFSGVCHLRFDDTNPEKEEQRYIDSIQEDIRWLGFKWHDSVRYTSDYFDTFYQWAIHLIKINKAYVDQSDAQTMALMRGDYNRIGVASEYRNRSIEDNLSELEKMRQGVYREGQCTLRAKIDLEHSNMNLRDPVLYRIRHQSHHQTQDKWCIYPSYDFAHGQGDAIEGITHSICTLEFQDHRPLYEWFIENLPVPHQPKQYEFARTNLNYTMTSKRHLNNLVEKKIVNGWDDPRMPTIAGLRRRGYTPQSIRKFADMVGVSRTDGIVDIAMLEHAVRDDLNQTATRVMVVLEPLKVILINRKENQKEEIVALNHPNHDMGERQLPFERTLYIDRNDFNEDVSLSRKKFKRLVPGEYVRLRNAYVIRHEQTIKNSEGEIIEIHCSVVEGTLGKNPTEDIRPRGVIHWVSAQDCCQIECRLYDRLFNSPEIDTTNENYLSHLNEESFKIKQGYGEISLLTSSPEQRFQFEREGYFVADRVDHNVKKLVFNLTIGLKDTWKKQFSN